MSSGRGGSCVEGGGLLGGAGGGCAGGGQGGGCGCDDVESGDNLPPEERSELACMTLGHSKDMGYVTMCC